MSISRRVTVGRLLGVSAAAVALTAVGATSAWAGDCPGGKGWDRGGHHGYKPGQGGGTKTSTDRCEFSLDGTAWYPSVKVDDVNLKPGEDGKVHVKVRVADGSASCTVSLASYRTHGPTFQTSGKQVFHDWDTVKITTSTDTLDVAVPDVTCFAQVDLYYGNKKYDGVLDANDGYEHGDLPEGPNHAVIGDKKIAWWNGGTKDCTTQTVPSTPATSTPTTPSGDETTPAGDETTPAGGEETTPAATETPSATAPASESAPASAAPSESVEAETSESPNGGSGDLAETGSSNVGMLSAAAAVLLAAGGGVVLATRRRQAARRH
ncbi:MULTISPECIES: LAETG motif-containing sortase-dependent surface protein [unclassified Streptomyces]|uniref:LAETG motif-containing sortase-dependent surface protein n=1 Tax=unclassified Streptomyces TaxID=2593676 RepID=UPI0003721513|nr:MULTISPECIES: LAETG motif-containing sortase-dependent surface protein [unclassified Streptomyces]MYX35432.1 LPXTG cell wall anchor domain-containing protein [Streptomyces sp. SID8377]